jgi:hypothetical protein
MNMIRARHGRPPTRVADGHALAEQEEWAGHIGGAGLLADRAGAPHSGVPRSGSLQHGVQSDPHISLANEHTSIRLKIGRAALTI